jgi:glutathione-independent formaldehyde dehydrogenase
MVRGRTTAPAGQTLGHEITGEVIELGKDVEFIKKGDIVSVPFNIACGRCPNCKAGLTGICLNVNPARPGAAYGEMGRGMGDGKGGQAGVWPRTNSSTLRLHSYSPLSPFPP